MIEHHNMEKLMIEHRKMEQLMIELGKQLGSWRMMNLNRMIVEQQKLGFRCKLIVEQRKLGFRCKLIGSLFKDLKLIQSFSI